LAAGGAWGQRGLSAFTPAVLAPDRLVAEAAVIVADIQDVGPGQLDELFRMRQFMGVPLIVVAEHAKADDCIALLKSGADDVVNGPVDLDLLAARVAAVARRHPRENTGEPALLMQESGLEIDLARRVVRRGGDTQSLSRTEFRLLLALLRAEGRTCTVRELVTQVWGGEHTSGPAYLRLYIRYLREKIEDDPRHPRRIMNVWGRGYRLALRPAATPVDGGPAARRSLPRPALALGGAV